ncbi:putative lipoprotein [Francisella sp. W12-1067]|nr:putative lipoprotein [Francisella sp. W12-1067]
MLNKYICGVSSVLGLAVLLSSCSQEELTEYQIGTNCDGAVCSIELDQADLLRYTNVVGKTVDKVLKQEAVPDPQYNITWVLTDGQFATNEQLGNSNLPLCNGDCTYESNPTGWVFGSSGAHQIGVSGTITYPDGTVQSIDIAKTVSTEYGQVKIESEVVGGSGLDYKFTANTTDTGIPDDATFTWKIDGTEVGTTQEIEYLFPAPNTTYTVSVEVSVDGEVISTDTKDILTGEIVEPTLIPVVDSSDPLTYTITADTTGTIIDSSWTKQWKINGNVVSGATTDILNYTFTQSDTTYQVEYIATKGELTRSATKTIQVGEVIQPTLITTPDSSDPLTYTITADTTNTSIDSSWTKQWKIDGSVVSGATTDTLNHTFTQSDTTYQVEYTATKGQSIRTATDTIHIGTVNQPSLSYSQDGSDPLTWTMIADTTGTIIDSSWTKQWKVNDVVVPGSTDTLNYTFALTSTTYNVTYTATKGQSTRSVTEPVLTGPATAPQLGSNRTDSLEFDLTADLTNTGITSDWALYWYFSPSSPTSGTIINSDTTNATVIFGDYNNYVITFKATPPSGSGLSPVTANISIDTLKTSMTMTGGNYFNIEGKGPAPVTGITWSTSGGTDKITFTCPSGYAYPDSILPPAVGTEINWPMGRDVDRLYLSFDDGGNILNDFNDTSTNLKYRNQNEGTLVVSMSCYKVY